MKEVESVLAEKRMKSGENQYTQKSPVPKSAHPSNERGKARDNVAKKVGLKSGHEVDRSIKAINTIDELTEKGRTEDAEFFYLYP